MTRVILVYWDCRIVRAPSRPVELRISLSPASSPLCTVHDVLKVDKHDSTRLLYPPFCILTERRGAPGDTGGRFGRDEAASEGRVESGEGRRRGEARVGRQAVGRSF